MFDIIGGFSAGVRILLEKGPSRHHISEDQEIPKNTRKLYFNRRLNKLEGEGERSNRAGSPLGGTGPPLAASACGEATLAHYCHRPFAYFIIPENLSQGGAQR
jgi:hypothetical protein